MVLGMWSTQFSIDFNAYAIAKAFIIIICVLEIV